MDKLRRLSRFYDAYQPRQLRTYRLAREWMEAEVSPEDATEWANLGYQPGEAQTLIAQGITPKMAATADEIVTDVAGGPEQRAMQVIDGLVADGTLVDPARVRQIQDPDDPDHIVVHIE